MNETATSLMETERERRERLERARAWLQMIGKHLAKEAALDLGGRLLMTPEGLVRVGCSRLELVTHHFREQGWLPWPDGSWTGGTAPW